MQFNLKKEITEYLTENLGIYIFISALFLLGIIVGALLVKMLGENETRELSLYLFAFYRQLDSSLQSIEQNSILQFSLQNNLKFALSLWFFGLLLIGFPFIIVLIFFRGLTLGFTVGFLIEQSALRGLLFSLGGILPHNLVIIPALIVVAVTGFSFSLLQLQRRWQRRSSAFFNHFWSYNFLIGLMVVVIIFGCFIEAYITPVFMRIIVPVM